jgi:hypothetical protein
MTDRQTQSREGAAVPNDHSLLVWVLDQILGLLKRSARTAEEQEAVKELRTQALLPKPDKATIESLVHRLDAMAPTGPEGLRTALPVKRAGVMESRPVRITLDRELNRLIESIGKKSAAKRAAGKKAALKAGATKTAARVDGKTPARKVAAKKAAMKAGGKKTTVKAARKKTAAVKNVPTKNADKRGVRHRSP